MKRYIAAVLINALLIQFVGCYSQKAITYKEFYDLQNTEEAIILTNQNKPIKLTTDSLKNNYVKWNAAEDSIIIWSTHYARNQKSAKVVSDTIKLASTEVDKVFIDELDGTKTFITIAVSAAVIILLGVLIKKNFKMFGGSLFGSGAHL
jgi:ElaB/YqjD/DUF883 family membrane-anchored ribosome-binding protein